jgi:hypothetical protein
MIHTLLFVLFSGCKGEQADSSIDTSVETPEEEEMELQSFEVTGTITDSAGAPLADAMVLVGGRKDTLTTSAEDGSFALWYTEIPYGEPAIVASKEGYRAIGYEFFKPDRPITLLLRKVNGPDNLEYIYEDPGNGFDSMKEDCSHCHTGTVLDFNQSKHADAASNPLVHDLYAGVGHGLPTEEHCLTAGGIWADGLEPGTDSAMEKCYIGGGVLPDLNPTCGGVDQLACDDTSLAEADHPTEFGACADCHAPGINGVAGDRNLHDAVGLAYEMGVHCDTCHKVRDIDMSQPPGVGKRLVMGRPSEPGQNTFIWDPVFYGPLIDVANVVMGGSPQPKFDEAVFCAGCHEQNQEALLPGQSLDEEVWPDGLPVHSTYSEWEEGPYNEDATPCQFCHMPANVELTNSVDIMTVGEQSITFGFPREPEDIRQHIFRGPLQGEPRLIDQSVYVSIDLEEQDSGLQATVSISNMGCGHAIPTGEPMRALHLLVEAESSCGPMPPSGGMTVQDGGGYLIQGVEGEGPSSFGSEVSWPEAAELALPGQALRVVRPTGSFNDYPGIGSFSEREAEDKGMERLEPIGQALILSIEDGSLFLSEDILTEEGDILYIGDEWTADAEDGQQALMLAGKAGHSFSKVLLDADGERHVPHYRAVGMASDNRIAPGSNVLTEHSFTLQEGCGSVEVHATLLYRPHPINIAEKRGWEAKDYIIAEAKSSLE